MYVLEFFPTTMSKKQSFVKSYHECLYPILPTFGTFSGIISVTDIEIRIPTPRRAQAPGTASNPCYVYCNPHAHKHYRHICTPSESLVRNHEPCAEALGNELLPLVVTRQPAHGSLSLIGLFSKTCPLR